MKFRCNVLQHPEFPYCVGMKFDSKAEALAHLERHPTHNVITAHFFGGGWSNGKLCICGAIIKEEYFDEHKCPPAKVRKKDIEMLIRTTGGPNAYHDIIEKSRNLPRRQK